MKADNPFILKSESGWKITPAGQEKLKSILTNTKGNVYAFSRSESPVIIAAAMARLSRRGDDMRITYLDEFSQTGTTEEADQLIHRVVTAYGDDSVQQLVGMHLVVEGASNLLTKLLEWGRLGAYLEQSTRYIFLDQKDSSGHYRYFVPANLDKQTGDYYRKIMDQLFGLYSTMVRDLTKYVRAKHPEPEDKNERSAWLGATRAQACDAVRAVLPVATKLTVGIFASAQSIESLIIHLLSEPLQEAQETGRQVLAEARKVIPAFLERTDLPERGGAASAFRAGTRSDINRLAQKYLPAKSKVISASVELIGHWPEDELDIVPEILFEQSNLALSEIRSEVQGWTAARKTEVLQAAFGDRLNRRHKTGRALEIPHYEFQITDDYGTFRDLQRHRIVDALEWQKLTPEYGYDVPELVREAGFESDFRKCFELAKDLYSRLSENYPIEAQYAVLLGHRMRYRLMLNARAAFHFLELRTSPQGHPGYRKICQQMHELIAGVHPQIASAMKFVNQGEDPELTRLAAERATQFKLQQLNNKTIKS